VKEMARPLRIEFEDAIYHLCGRGNARQPIFRDERDCARFLELLGESAQRFEAAILCFVLMGNHFHLVAQTHRPNLRKWMHWLLVSYTVYFNRRHRFSGHLFQGRYKSFLVQEGDYLLGLSRYVHLNPVRGKVIGGGGPVERRKRLRAFKWSSYRGYAGLGAQFPFVKEEMVLGELRGPRRAERLRYRRFVEEGLLREIQSPFEAVRWQAVLGDESFVRKLRDRFRGLHKQRREITALRRATPSADVDKILEKVAQKYEVDRARLVARSEWGLPAKNIAMWMIWETGTKSLREIGELFGGLDYAAVAQRIRRARSSCDEATARKLISRILNV
jgi:putative transposase